MFFNKNCNQKSKSLKKCNLKKIINDKFVRNSIYSMYVLS